MLNNSQGSQGNNDLQTAQNAIAIMIDQISKARGVGRTIVIDKNWLNNQLSALQNSLPAAVHQAQAVLKEKKDDKRKTFSFYAIYPWLCDSGRTGSVDKRAGCCSFKREFPN